MKTTKQADGWWINDVPAYCADAEWYTSCGPYRTRAEAEDDMRGLARSYAELATESRVAKPSAQVMEADHDETLPLFNRGDDR